MTYEAIRTLIDDVERYCEARGIKESTFGQQAVKDRNFISRLRDGGRCWPETIDKVRAFMAERPPLDSARGAAAE